MVTGAVLTIFLPFFLQMHHPIQMKPADSEKTSGEWIHVKCRVKPANGLDRTEMSVQEKY